MTITYKDTKEFNAQELQDLFLSVHWSSGYHPEKLVIAMQNYSTVYSAWDGENKKTSQRFETTGNSRNETLCIIKRTRLFGNA